MTEPEKKNKSEEFETISNTVKLQKKVFTACDDLDGHAESIGKEIFNSMLAHHYEQYLREYEKMNAQKLLDVDKEIAEFKIKREKELAAIKELQAKQTHELEELRKQREREFELEKARAEKEFEIYKTKELGEMQLEHERVKADIERQRAKLNTELKIWKQTNEDELEAKRERVTPGYKLRRRFLGIPIGRLKPNQAWLLAMESADIETQEYLVSRAQEIAERKAKAFGLDFKEQEESEGLQEEPEDEMQTDLAPISKKDRKALIKRIKRLSKTESGEKLMTDIAATLDTIQPQEPSEPVFVPEAMTKRELKLYLQNLEREDYLEYKAQRKAVKAELKRLKKEAKKAEKSKQNATDPKSKEVQEPTEPGGQVSENEENKGG